MPTMLLTVAALILSACTATDGDTIRCRTPQAGSVERIRLLGIDAPELPGHCRAGRRCAPGDPFAARANMARLLQRRPLAIRRFGFDRYGRTLATVSAGGTDLSCAQLQGRFAVYVPAWDEPGWVRRTCPAAARSASR